ncbi:hypothetical protein [Arenibacter echinorum]|uniref:Lipoprotein n=1 Tax=Arenibacter echinorum TaxID=440515 RepID=A0A327RJW8_9FLAO|nr:hypothetical protein [Arenibacter echinorum]RAJ15854.1 hypothetical protein LV92_00557 [Arenibacter echinorum]
MKKFHLPAALFFTLIFFSCLGPKTENNNFSTDSDFSSGSDSGTGIASFFGNDSKSYEYKDPKSGFVVSKIDYPSDWKVVYKPEYDVDPLIPFFLYQIQGPSNTEIFNTPLKMFYASPNPQIEQNMRNSGMQNVRSLVSLEEILDKEIRPMMTTKGFSFERQKPLPELDRFFAQKVHESAPQAATKVLTTEWKGANNQKGLVIISYVQMQQPLFTGDVANIWLYTTDFLIADNERFGEVIETFVNANIQAKENSEWKNHVASINNKRQMENRRQRQLQIENMDNATRAMAQTHQYKMRDRQASFDAHQKRMADMSAARDASHANFMNNNFGSNSSSSSYSGGGQQSFLNMISEEETVAHPNGNTYQVEAGAKEYWMDDSGNYIKSNDLFYDPNAGLDNNTEWTKVMDDY